MTGMLFTFVFLGLNTVLQPFCTLPLSRLQSCSLLSQIVSLFGGLMLILQKFINKEIIASGEPVPFDLQSKMFEVLIFFVNATVVFWPAIQVTA
jgi:hypothetical protein